MARIGYARVSSTDQDTALQVAALRAARCDVIRQERVSGTSMSGRDELANILDFIRSGDALVVTRVDRLARSIGDLASIVGALRERGADLVCTEQPVDTSTAAGECFLNMLGVFAQFETALRRERQMEGIAKKKAEGGYKGRKPSIDVEAIRQLATQGIGATEIARRLAIGRASVYRIMAGSEASGPATAAHREAA